MPLTKNQLIIIGVVGAIVLFFVLGFLGVIPVFQSSNTTPAPGTISAGTLTMWGVDPEENYKGVFENYVSTHAGAKINYTQFDSKTYENSLLNAFAIGKGPDVFMFHRSWLPKQGDKIVPVLATTLPIQTFRQLFPDVVEKDFTFNSQIYALPLYLDSLAFVYNKDIFNAKGLALTPTTWNNFLNIIKPLTEFDFSHQIKKAGAAIGGSNNGITNATDLLALIMFQSGAQIIDPQNLKVTFDQKALSAFSFYLQFASPSSNYYTWTDNFGNSVDTFSSGDTAVIFSYAKTLNTIKAKNPFLNFAVSPMLQFNADKPVNYADYWGLAVSRQSKNQPLAWNFVISATTDTKNSMAYLQAANLPPALRVLINQYLTDPNLNVFAKQALTAKSVYQLDYNTFSQAFSNMISSVLSGKQAPQEAMDSASNAINPAQ